jgi:hypothetical protein
MVYWAGRAVFRNEPICVDREHDNFPDVPLNGKPGVMITKNSITFTKDYAYWRPRIIIQCYGE